MKLIRILLILALCLLSGASSLASNNWEGKLPWHTKARQPMRIVTLGDSITDGNTYQMLVAQALFEANKPVPILTNAGVGGDTIAAMRARLDRDVIAYHPNMVTISAGANDAVKAVTADSFEVDLNAIVDRLESEQVKIVLLTTCIFGPKLPGYDGTLASYNEIIHEVGAQRNIPVAEVNGLMRRAATQGDSIMEADGIHPNFAGQRIIARALLDALGDADIAVPEVLKPLLMPGVISDWKLRIAPNGKPLVKDDVLRLTPDASWTDYPLPETMPVDGWLDQERQRGFAVSVAKVLGSDKPIQGYATLMNDDKGTEHSFFNTGAQLQTIWLNGTRVYQSMSWTGWHAGKERIPVDLLPGKNTVIVESTGPFFLSVTDSDKW